MLTAFDSLRGMDLFSVVVRMALAVLCGGFIGFERSYKRRPAGFRTHLLICLGACITTMTSQYLAVAMHYPTDPARLGAQVIAGVGFIGAGTIIVTRRRRVKGLTTAAGLWTTAIVGLAIGAGYFEAALCTTVLVLVAELLFSRVEYQLMRRFRDTYLYLEYENGDVLDSVITMLREHGATVDDMEISHGEHGSRCAIFTVKNSRKPARADTLLSELAALPGVLAIEEM